MQDFSNLLFLRRSIYWNVSPLSGNTEHWKSVTACFRFFCRYYICFRICLVCQCVAFHLHRSRTRDLVLNSKMYVYHPKLPASTKKPVNIDCTTVANWASWFMLADWKQWKKHERNRSTTCLLPLLLGTYVFLWAVFDQHKYHRITLDSFFTFGFFPKGFEPTPVTFRKTNDAFKKSNFKWP